jgi:hypothetical protein
MQDLLNFLFGRPDATGDADQEWVAATVEAIVDQVEPRVRMVAGYQRKLEAGVKHTIAYLRGLGRDLPEDVLTLSRAAWGRDPQLNAFFATANDVPACLGRSKPLRTLLDSPGTAEAYALLAMRLEERQIFAPKLVGAQLHQDVAQTSVSFTSHRLFAPTLSLVDTRREVGRLLFLRLAQVALAGIIAADEKAVDLTQHKGYLSTRLRLLNLAKDGMEGIVKDPATIDAEIRAVQAELKRTMDEYIEIKSSIATMDRYIDRIDAVLRQPEKHIRLTHERLRVNRLGIKADADETGAVNELAVTELHLGEVAAVIALVRCPREELPPPEDLIAQAERTL